MKIAIASAGRFHLLDLARELDALGHEVLFYSYVPLKRAEGFGLPKHCHVGLLAYVFPLVWWERTLPAAFPSVVERLMCWALDRLVIWKMRPCDLFICMSGIYVAAPRHAKQQHGAKVVLHRGSVHILAQQAILSKIPHARQVSRFMIARELKGYALADQISVASHHVVESFKYWPYAAKLRKNPYGVDVAQFPLAKSERDRETVLYIGQWSYRKGVDILADAITSLDGIHLCHVGAIGDAPFPTGARFAHYDHVSQDRLSAFYARACVFVLASREDGFGMVLSQALVSGCLVVCTDRTGGPDLAEIGELERLIRIVPAGDADALAQAIRASLQQAIDCSFAPISQAERMQLSWRCYAEREMSAVTSEEAKDSEVESLHRAFHNCAESA